MHAATSAARVLRPLARPTLLLSTRTRLSSALPCGARHASKKAKGGGATSTLVPGSQLVSADAGAVAAHAATDAKMAAAADWFRREVAAAGARAAGRVSPALLDPVRVVLPGGRNAKLEEVATVGVKDGTALLVTVFEEANMKLVEAAIYAAKIPQVTPQRHDARTIKIPIPKPTVDARLALAAAAQKQAEETRVQIRKLHQAAVKKGGYKKFSIELESFDKLVQQHIAEVDKTLAEMKKAAGAK